MLGMKTLLSSLLHRIGVNMAKSKRIPLVGGFYEDRSKNLNAQRTVNLYPITSPEGKQPSALYSTPGTNIYLTRNVGNLGQNPEIVSDFMVDLSSIYGAVAYTNSSLTQYALMDFANSSNIQYVPSTFGTPGAIPTTSARTGAALAQDSDSVYMVIPTTTTLGSETVTSNLYRLDKSNTANFTYSTFGTTWTVRPSDIAYMDGYLIINHLPSTLNDPWDGTFLANFVNMSAPLNRPFNDLDFAKMYYMNDTVLRVLPAGGYLYVLGRNHLEVWFNSGNELFPFEPIKEATKEIGLVHAKAVCRYMDNVAFIGSTASSCGIYLLTGTQVKKISTPAIDVYLDKYAGPAVHSKLNLNNINPSLYGAYSYKEGGHAFICFRILGTGDIDTTLVYDMTTEAWHERNQKNGANTVSVIRNAGSLGSTTFLAIDGTTNIYKYDIEKHTDDVVSPNTPIERYRISQHIGGDDVHIFHNRVRVDIEPTQANNVDANVYLYHSDDDAKTWQFDGAKSFSAASYGNISGDKRLEWFRLGRSDDRIYKIWTNANTAVYIAGGYADVTGGYR